MADMESESIAAMTAATRATGPSAAAAIARIAATVLTAAKGMVKAKAIAARAATAATDPAGQRRAISATKRCAPRPSGRSLDHTTSTHRSSSFDRFSKAISTRLPAAT